MNSDRRAGDALLHGGSDVERRPEAGGRSEAAEKKRRDVVRWRDLPHQGQLTVLTLARLSEPLVQTSLQSYMFYQLRSFDPSLADSTIASQAGILNASFTATQFLTAMVWGQLADSPRFGRKRVLMIGLSGTSALPVAAVEQECLSVPADQVQTSALLPRLRLLAVLLAGPLLPIPRRRHKRQHWRAADHVRYVVALGSLV